MIAISFALPAESSEFIRLLQNPARVRRSGIERITGVLHGQHVCVMHTGVGEKSTRARVGTFLEDEAPGLLISSGFAGALNESLAVGDLLLAENFSAASLLAAAATAVRDRRFMVGRLTTAQTVLDSPEARRQIGESTQAAAVDMETEFIAELCRQRSIPMLSLRAITDTPLAPFPAPPHLLFNLERQKTEFAPLFWHLLLRPAAIVRFLSFAQTIAKTRSILTSTLELVLRERLV